MAANRKSGTQLCFFMASRLPQEGKHPGHHVCQYSVLSERTFLFLAKKKTPSLYLRLEIKLVGAHMEGGSDKANVEHEILFILF